MSLRDDLRAATLGSSDGFKSEIVEVNGSEFEIREPSVKRRASIIAAVSGAKDDEERISLGQALAVVSCVFVPGTNDPVFEHADLESLLNAPAGGWLDTLFAKASDYLHVNELSGKL